jgi:acetoin utilization protein AcuB
VHRLQREEGRVTATIADYMSRPARCIQRDQPLVAAHSLMREHRIRHLPVLDGDRLVGLLSERDLHLTETLRSVDPRKESVAEAMTESPFTVTPQASLAYVAEVMFANRYGSAVVVEHGQVVGIFTTMDALRALVDRVRFDKNGA